eukprot:729188-Rhodomonas_salina.4
MSWDLPAVARRAPERSSRAGARRTRSSVSTGMWIVCTGRRRSVCMPSLQPHPKFLPRSRRRSSQCPRSLKLACSHFPRNWLGWQFLWSALVVSPAGVVSVVQWRSVTSVLWLSTELRIVDAKKGRSITIAKDFPDVVRWLSLLAVACSCCEGC